MSFNKYIHPDNHHNNEAMKYLYPLKKLRHDSLCSIPQPFILGNH